jgi:hypothetical protein
MSFKAGLCGVLVVAMSATLAGCNPYPLPGPLHYTKCGIDAHTESYPYAHDDRRAYGCKTDDNGFLESDGQGDKRRN